VAEGERLAVLGKIPDTRLKGGESITVMKVEDGQLTVQRPGQKTTQTLAVGAGVFDGIKIGHGWVESPGRSVSETATVFASVTQRELDNATLNQLAQSGSHLRLYSAQDAAHDGEAVAAYRLQRGLRAAEDPIRRDGPGCGHCAAEGRTAYPGRTGHSPGHPAA
jgi:hypothetical protein